MNEKIERRYSPEMRVENSGKKKIVTGIACCWNKPSENLGYDRVVTEYLMPGCITQEVLDRSDIFALLNHKFDEDRILARSFYDEGGSLKLTIDDEIGLRYEFEVPNTAFGNEVYEAIKRKDIRKSSFAFTVAEDEIITLENGDAIRNIIKIDKLFDVSPVTFAAYNSTSSEARSMEENNRKEMDKYIEERACKKKREDMPDEEEGEPSASEEENVENKECNPSTDEEVENKECNPEKDPTCEQKECNPDPEKEEKEDSNPDPEKEEEDEEKRSDEKEEEEVKTLFDEMPKSKCKKCGKRSIDPSYYAELRSKYLV